jgi:hypothetical protein
MLIFVNIFVNITKINIQLADVVLFCMCYVQHTKINPSDFFCALDVLRDQSCIRIVFGCQCCNKIKEVGTVLQCDWVQDRGIVAASLNSFGIAPCTFPPNRKNCGISH